MDTTHPAESQLAALRDAVAVIGSQSAMGRLLGVSQPAISAWLKERRPLPAEHVLTVERATGIPRHRLRSDLYPLDEAPHGAIVPPAAPGDSANRAGTLASGSRSVLGDPVR